LELLNETIAKANNPTIAVNRYEAEADLLHLAHQRIFHGNAPCAQQAVKTVYTRLEIPDQGANYVFSKVKKVGF
jgi:hypothetical protein